MKMYDVIVIGFGKAGKTLAGQLGKQGKKVALIEKDNGMYGGTCINVGCIPSKRLITEAATAPKSDFASKAAYYKKAIEGKRALTGALNQANYNKLIQAGVEVIDGMASFVDATHVEVKTKDGVLQLEGKQFVINTGATSVIPGIPGVKDSDKVYTSESMMDLDELPEKLNHRRRRLHWPGICSHVRQLRQQGHGRSGYRRFPASRRQGYCRQHPFRPGSQGH